jgi:hypothetical protein
MGIRTNNMEVHYPILIIHLVVGFVLVFFALKAFKKTKYPPMMLLAIGFSLIVLGDTVIGDLADMLDNESISEIIEESIEIAGFVVLIISVKRS